MGRRLKFRFLLGATGVVSLALLVEYYLHGLVNPWLPPQIHAVWTTLPALVILVGSTWFFLQRRVFHPLGLLERSTAEVAQGSLEAGMVPEASIPGGAIGEIIRSRNRMLAALQDSQKRLAVEEAALRESEARYRILFENAPISLWEEDASRIKEWMDGLRESGVEDFRAYFEANPEAVHRCAFLLKVKDVSRATLELYRARSKEELLGNMAGTFTPEAFNVFREALIALAEGRTSFEGEAVTKTLDGESVYTAAKWQVAPGHEKSLSKILVSILDLTDRRKMEEELLKFKLGIERSGEAVFITDRDGKIVYANPAFEKIYGYSPDEVLNQTPRILKSGVLSDEEYGDFWKALLDRQVVSGEIVNRTKDGRLLTIDGSANPILDEAGKITGFLAIQRDISERKRVEETLRESEDRFRRVFHSAGIGMALVSPQGRFLETNAAFQCMFGYRAEDYPGLTFMDLTHPEDLARSIRLQRELIEGVRDAGRMEKRYLRKDGGLVWADTSTTAIRDAGGKLRYFVAMVEDITQHKQAEDAVAESEARLKGLLEHLPAGVCLLDRNRRVLLANAEAREQLRLLADADVGDELSRLGDLRVADLVASPDVQAEEAVTVASKNRVFEVEACSVQPELSESGWVLVIRDVTAEREMRERAQQQDRLAAVGQLAAGIAHDFNNVLTPITGFAEVMEMREDLPQTVRRHLRTISSQGQRAAQLIRQVLDFSRKTVVERMPVELSPFLKEDLKLLKRTLPESIRFETSLECDGCVVRGNLGQLQQVLTNLAVNSRDAMPDGGVLSLSLKPLEVSDSGGAPLPGLRPGKWAVLEVRDTGIGMSQEVLEHIYEPFFTTKKPGEGTGLGLAQVYGIVKQHGGEIDVTSRPGKGTAFRIYLPEIGREALTQAPRREEPPRGNGETVLVVEDEDGVRKTARALLEHLNYRVMIASDGILALEMYERHKEKISLVLTDMVMPKMSGAQLIGRLREKNCSTPILLMSGYTWGGEGERPLPEGITAYVEKPLCLENLGKAVCRALYGGKGRRREGE